MRRAMDFVMLLPRNICVVVLRIYRAVISPLYGDVCRYYPSCSSYALQTIQGHGVIRGVALGSLRLARCHPWASGGVDDVPENARHHHHITGFGFVYADASGASSCEAPKHRSTNERADPKQWIS